MCDVETEHTYLNYLQTLALFTFNTQDSSPSVLPQTKESIASPSQSKSSPSRNPKSKRRSASHNRSTSLNSHQWQEVFALSPQPITGLPQQSLFPYDDPDTGLHQDIVDPFEGIIENANGEVPTGKDNPESPDPDAADQCNT